MADEAVLKAIAELGSALRGEMAEMRTVVMARIDRQQDAIAEMRGEIMARIDRQQNSIESIRDDVAVNFGRADRAALVGEEVRAMATEMNAMQRQILRLRTDVEELRKGQA
jgi:hypothetical protein